MATAGGVEPELDRSCAAAADRIGDGRAVGIRPGDDRPDADKPDTDKPRDDEGGDDDTRGRDESDGAFREDLEVRAGGEVVVGPLGANHTTVQLAGAAIAAATLTDAVVRTPGVSENGQGGCCRSSRCAASPGNE